MRGSHQRQEERVKNGQEVWKAKTGEVKESGVLLEKLKTGVEAEVRDRAAVALGEPMGNQDGKEFGIDFAGTALGVAGGAGGEQGQ